MAASKVPIYLLYSMVWRHLVLLIPLYKLCVPVSALGTCVLCAGLCRAVPGHWPIHGYRPTGRGGDQAGDCSQDIISHCTAESKSS